MKDERKQQRQETILLEALKLFTERGYFNTSVSDIQSASNLSVGTLYNYFKNKEAIAITLFSNIENCLYENLCEIDRKHNTVYDRYKAIIQHLFETAERNPESMQYLFYTKHRDSMPVEKSVFTSLPFLKMKDMIVKGQQAGIIREMDPHVAMVTLFGGPIRMISLRIDGVLELPLPEYFEQCWDSAWRGVRV
jgi:TetR/AcrR family transcriptional regulator, repressor of fatR-cypB operon